MSGRRSALGWAEEQRALRARAAAPGFAPSTVPVEYRLVTASGTGDVPGVGGLVPRLALLGVAEDVMLY